MAINYVTKYGPMLDQRINQGLVTSVLGSADASLVAGTQTVKIQTIATTGFKPHTRGKGFNQGEVSNTSATYQLTQDRDIEFFVDTQDVDETNMALSIANISQVFFDEHATPEIDAYRFSTLAKKAGNTQSVAITKANAYAQIKAAIKPLRKYGAQNIVAFVSSDVMDALEQSTEFTRSITNQNVGLTTLESRVTSVDGVQLIEVWDASRFQTDYDFSDGYAPASDALGIGVLAVAKQAVLPIVKESAIFMFAPGEHTQGDGYLYQNRLYHDIFVLDQKKDGISVVTSPKA